MEQSECCLLYIASYVEMDDKNDAANFSQSDLTYTHESSYTGFTHTAVLKLMAANKLEGDTLLFPLFLT